MTACNRGCVAQILKYCNLQVTLKSENESKYQILCEVLPIHVSNYLNLIFSSLQDVN